MSQEANEPPFPFKIYARFRPFTKDEGEEAKCSSVFHKLGKRVMVKYGVDTPLEVELDGAFNNKSSNGQIYDSVGPGVSNILMKGYNCTLVCDGFPKTGKTSTMIGEGAQFATTEKESDGIFPRLVKTCFDHILMGSDENIEFSIGVSTYAILSGTGVVTDLLSETLDTEEGLACSLQEETGEVDLEGLLVDFVGGDTDVLDILDQVLPRRPKNSTFVVELTITQKNPTANTNIKSRLCCIDLESRPLRTQEENGSQTFADICNSLTTGDEEYDLYSTALRAVLYSRTCNNCFTSVIMNCSPTVEDAADLTVPSLEFLKSLEVMAVEAVVNQANDEPEPTPTPAPAQKAAPAQTPAQSSPKVDTSAYETQITSLKKQLNTVQEQKDELEMSLANVKKQNQTLQVNIDKAQADKTALATLQGEISALKKQLDAAQQQKEQLDKSLQTAKSQTLSLQTALDKATFESKKLSTDHKSTISSLESTHSEQLNKLNQDIETHKRTSTTLSAQLKQLQESLSKQKSDQEQSTVTLNNELSKERKTIQDLTTTVHELKNQLDEKQRIVHQQQTNLEEYTNKIERLTHDILQFKTSHSELENRFSALTLQFESTQRERSDEQSKYASTTKQQLDQITCLNNKIQQFESTIQKQESESNDRIKTLQSQLEQSYAQMNQIKSSNNQQQESQRVHDLQMEQLKSELTKDRQQWESKRLEMSNELSSTREQHLQFIQQLNKEHDLETSTLKSQLTSTSQSTSSANQSISKLESHILQLNVQLESEKNLNQKLRDQMTKEKLVTDQFRLEREEEYKQLNTQLNVLNERSEVLDQRRNEMESLTNHLEAELTRVSDLYQGGQHELNQLQNQVILLTNQNNQLEQTHTSQVNSLHQTIHQQSITISTREEQIQKMTNQLNESNQSLLMCTQQLEQSTLKLEHSNQQLLVSGSEQNNQLEQLNVQNQNLVNQSRVDTKTILDLKQSLERLKQESESQKQNLLQRSHSENMLELNRLTTQLEQSIKEKESLLVNNKQFESDLVSTKKLHSEQVNEISQLKDQISKLNAELTKLSSSSSSPNTTVTVESSTSPSMLTRAPIRNRGVSIRNNNVPVPQSILDLQKQQQQQSSSLGVVTNSSSNPRASIRLINAGGNNIRNRIAAIQTSVQESNQTRTSKPRGSIMMLRRQGGVAGSPGDMTVMTDSSELTNVVKVNQDVRRHRMSIRGGQPPAIGQPSLLVSNPDEYVNTSSEMSKLTDEQEKRSRRGSVLIGGARQAKPVQTTTSTLVSSSTSSSSSAPTVVVKSGFLTKEGGMKFSSWQKKYCAIVKDESTGKSKLNVSMSADGTVQEEYELSGGNVTMAPEKQNGTNRFFCFRVNCADGRSVNLNAAMAEDKLDWMQKLNESCV